MICSLQTVLSSGTVPGGLEDVVIHTWMENIWEDLTASMVKVVTGIRLKELIIL